jgi:propionyl-CoA synthetase
MGGSGDAEFWAEQARLVDWIRKPRRAFDDGGWYADGTLNTCYNALDRHVVHGHGDRPALVHVSPSTGATQELSYAELLERTAAFAGALRGVGVGPGDRVVVHLPVVPEALVAMLACARLGAVHVVLAADSDADTVARRIDDTRPVVVVTASDRGLDRSSHRPASVIVKQGPDAPAELDRHHVDWDVAVRAGATDPAESVEVRATDPLYVLDHLVRDNGGHAVAMAWLLPHAYDVQPGQVWWAACDLAVPLGHSYAVYAPLLAGATTVLVEGGTPDAGTVAQVVEEHGVEVLLAGRDVLDRLPGGGGGLRAAFSTEPLDDDASQRAADRLGVRVQHAQVPAFVQDVGALS